MIYFSIDIETNGLCAGINSMISLGCAAINIDTNEIVATFIANIKPLPDMQVDADTMNWWKDFPDAYARATENAEDAAVVMPRFAAWVEYIALAHNQAKQPVAAAWKPGFDLAFLRFYLFRFCGGDIFGRAGSGLDIKTLAAIALDQPFSETRIADVPAWLKGTLAAHSHDALDDALEQAHVLFFARKQLRSRL